MYDECVKSLDNYMKTINSDQEPIEVILNFSYEIPEYNDMDYIKMKKKQLDKLVILPASNQFEDGKYLITTVTEIPRDIQQRICLGKASGWENRVRLYNFFADEYGYKKIVKKINTLNWL